MFKKLFTFTKATAKVAGTGCKIAGVWTSTKCGNVLDKGTEKMNAVQTKLDSVKK